MTDKSVKFMGYWTKLPKNTQSHGWKSNNNRWIEQSWIENRGIAQSTDKTFTLFAIRPDKILAKHAITL